MKKVMSLGLPTIIILWMEILNLYTYIKVIKLGVMSIVLEGEMYVLWSSGSKVRINKQ